MNAGRLAILTVVGLCFATLVLYLLVARQGQGGGRREAPPAAPASFSGKLDIRAMDDMRVGGRKLVLCGVTFAKPRAMEQVVREQARRGFQGRQVDCMQVGGGTPCDGRAAASFGGATVAQCRTSEGLDLAREFAERGYLCDLPAQSGGAYRGC